ncbi:MAG: hypothetical protein E6K53_09350 [Gammaproteobacteria bacterium]|nr:MAG: hypothetical protein E6K53_09350 [Gammaproteobacteria bacterium]
MGQRDPRVDAYIAKSAAFAQPILTHVREVIHAGCPDTEEAIKWGMPSFLYRGKILCGIAAFKQHCAFGFWKGRELGYVESREGEAMGQFGRITTLKDLPPKKELLALIKRAMQDSEIRAAQPRAVVPKKTARPAPETPDDFAAALKKDKKALAVYAAFSPSAKREYVDWITEAKREETRAKRLAQAVEWIAEGKQRNWKYMNC